jgi:hypothetical protein
MPRAADFSLVCFFCGSRIARRMRARERESTEKKGLVPALFLRKTFPF